LGDAERVVPFVSREDNKGNKVKRGEAPHFGVSISRQIDLLRYALFSFFAFGPSRETNGTAFH
jgi:hypothetical protein